MIRPLVAFLALAGACFAAGPTPLSTAVAEWTVLAYLDGEGTLTASTLHNVEQAMKVGSTPAVQLVALVDRPPSDPPTEDAKPALPHWSGARFARVAPGELETLEDWGPTNMADPATLERFIKQAIARYPARRYLLIIGDHGLAWGGVCTDLDGRDRLTLPELAAALEHCRRELAGKLAIVGMDACLMASVEVAAELAPHARWLVASEEAAPTDGWRYDLLLGELNKRPAAPEEDLARAIVDHYHGQFVDTHEDSQLREALGVTLSVVSLAKMAPVTAAIDELAAASLEALKTKDGFETLARARAASPAFGATERADAGYEMFDLCDLVDQLRQGPARTRPALAKALDRVEAAARSAVPYNRSGRARSDAKGLSLFWPGGPMDLEDDDAHYADLALSRTGRWGRFIEAYATEHDVRTPAVRLADFAVLQNVASRAAPASIAARLEAGVPTGAYIGLWAPGGALLATRPTDLTTATPLEDTFDGRWMQVTDGGPGFPADVADLDDLDGGQDEVVMHLSAQLCRRNEQVWQDVVLHFYLDLKGDEAEGELAYVASQRPGAPDLIRLHEHDRLRPNFWSFEKGGKLKRQDPRPGQYEIELKRPRELRLALRPLKPGDYEIGVVTKDAEGRWLGMKGAVRVTGIESGHSGVKRKTRRNGRVRGR